MAEKVVYTGPIDAYFGYQLGTLEHRSVRFETEAAGHPQFSGQCRSELYGSGDSVDPDHRAQMV